tara:strand:- start:1811 stop:2677 length:867 start_codon:yes stop_codon:yes gene_type:complete
MKVIKTIKELRSQLIGQSRIAFVPTMGHIHEGHLSLIRQAKLHGDPVICSIFINPLQFGKNEDFNCYPRSLTNDISKLNSEGIYVVFTPTVSEMYPQNQEFCVLPPKDLSKILEGKYRTDFFMGVTTIVLKLFQCVQPRFAIFGKKDYQQLLIVKRMCDQFFINTKIIAAETVRDEDGLALSSRNTYLDKSERKKAPLLFESITKASKEIQRLSVIKKLNTNSLLSVELETQKLLDTNGWNTEYVKIRSQRNLTKLNDGELKMNSNLVILAASWLGSTRLIDNLEFSI